MKLQHKYFDFVLDVALIIFHNSFILRCALQLLAIPGYVQQSPYIILFQNVKLWTTIKKSCFFTFSFTLAICWDFERFTKKMVRQLV